jgi:hypothetical protein
MCCIGMLGERCVCAKRKLKRLQRERMVDGKCSSCCVCIISFLSSDSVSHVLWLVECLSKLSSSAKVSSCLYYWSRWIVAQYSSVKEDIYNNSVVLIGSGVVVRCRRWSRCHRVCQSGRRRALCYWSSLVQLSSCVGQYARVCCRHMLVCCTQPTHDIPFLSS